MTPGADGSEGARPGAGVVVRAARPGEGRLVEQVRLATWRSAYAGLLDAAYLAGRRPDEEGVAGREARIALPPPALTLVAELDGRIVGVAGLGPARDDDLDAGTVELGMLYVLPDAWGHGVGRVLLAAGLDQRPAPLHVLWVLEHNSHARRFYERNGFCPDGARVLLELGRPTPEVRYRRSS